MKTKEKSKLNRLTDSRLGGLRLLLREVLQQIPPEDAEKLRAGHVDGKLIVLTLRQSKGGVGCKTAFSYCLAESVAVSGREAQGGNTTFLK